MDKGGGKESTTIRLRLEDPLHPVVVLGLLGDDDDDVALLETKLIFVVSLAVVQGSTSLVTVVLVPLLQLQRDDMRFIREAMETVHNVGE